MRARRYGIYRGRVADGARNQAALRLDQPAPQAAPADRGPETAARLGARRLSDRGIRATGSRTVRIAAGRGFPDRTAWPARTLRRDRRCRTPLRGAEHAA